MASKIISCEFDIGDSELFGSCRQRDSKEVREYLGLAKRRLNILGWRVGWSVARRSFLSMCNKVCEAPERKFSALLVSIVVTTDRLAGIIKAKEQDFGILVHETLRR